MICVSPKHKIYLAIEPIDFRKGIDAIIRLCQNQLKQNPWQGQYFIFRNKRKTDVKLLYYDTQGFCLFHKRLSTGQFSYWPNIQVPLVTLTPAQLQVLLFNGNPQYITEGKTFRDYD